MNQLKAIIAAGTLTGLILVTAIVFGVRGVNALASQDSTGATRTEPVITQVDSNPAYGEEEEHEYDEHEYEEYDDD